MKLIIVQVGTDKNHELNIRNPHAAVANLRAAIAIALKVESRSFIMSHKGQDLDDETKKLSGGGNDGLNLQDGDTITITVRRPRDSTNSNSSAASPTGTTTNNKDIVASASRKLNSKKKLEDVSSDDDEEEGDEEVEDLDLDEEGADWLTDEDEEDEENEFDEEAEAEANEIARMFDLLSALPNQAEMRQRFRTDPEGTLRSLQTEKPELFQLINKHPQAFLSMVNEDEDDDFAAGEEGEWIGDGDEMSPADAEFMQHLLEQAGSGSDDDGDHEIDFAELLAQNSNNNNNQAGSDGTNTTRRRRGAAAGRRATGGNTSTNTRRQQTGAVTEASLTDEDNQNIMRIVELGFSREQAMRAYIRFNKNADRAAAWLFENPPS